MLAQLLTDGRHFDCARAHAQAAPTLVTERAARPARPGARYTVARLARRAADAALELVAPTRGAAIRRRKCASRRLRCAKACVARTAGPGRPLTVVAVAAVAGARLAIALDVVDVRRAARVIRDARSSPNAAVAALRCVAHAPRRPLAQRRRHRRRCCDGCCLLRFCRRRR